MKHALLTISVSFAFAASPALAQDTVQINQHGSGGAVVIDQIASGGSNTVSVNQHEGWGGSHVEVMQSQVTQSSATVFQSGNNQVNVFQHDGANLTAEVNSHGQYYDPYGGYGYGGEQNYVMIDQSGFGAWARVDQAGGTSFNQATVTQSSQGGLMAEVFQHGSSNQANIFQTGANLNATIVQGGSNNQAQINQGSPNWW